MITGREIMKQKMCKRRGQYRRNRKEDQEIRRERKRNVTIEEKLSLKNFQKPFQVNVYVKICKRDF